MAITLIDIIDPIGTTVITTGVPITGRTDITDTTGIITTIGTKVNVGTLMPRSWLGHHFGPASFCPRDRGDGTRRPRARMSHVREPNGHLFSIL